MKQTETLTQVHFPGTINGFNELFTRTLYNKLTHSWATKMVFMDEKDHDNSVNRYCEYKPGIQAAVHYLAEQIKSDADLGTPESFCKLMGEAEVFLKMLE